MDGRASKLRFSISFSRFRGNDKRGNTFLTSFFSREITSLSRPVVTCYSQFLSIQRIRYVFKRIQEKDIDAMELFIGSELSRRRESSHQRFKDANAEQLARRLAKATGESIPQVVARALEERWQKLRPVSAPGVRAEQILEIAKRGGALPELDRRSPDPILGYAEDGTLQ